MSNRNRKRNKVICLNHRKSIYLKSLDKLFKGTVPPEYVSERWNKLQEIKGK
jgi:hypothetical protein